MLPPPTIVFTIPSIHDDTVLDCRVYHPLRLNPSTVSQVSAPWEKKAAIVAHPYAPLGGCYDDAVVDIVASTILKQGFIVGTFNFRGAGSSKGATSWSSKPEQGDYISMIGFMRYYMHFLAPPTRRHLSLGHSPFVHVLNDDSEAIRTPPPESDHTSGPSAPAPTTTTSSNSLLILAGYSYGGLITTCLPPLSSPTLLPLFNTPQHGSPHAEIRLRAQNLATQQNEMLQTRFEALVSQSAPISPLRSEHGHISIDDNGKFPKATLGVRMGGEEDLRRSSHESHQPRRSFTIEAPERVRMSLDKVRSLARTNRFPCQRDGSSGSMDASVRSKDGASDTSLRHGSNRPEKADPPSDLLEEIPGITQVDAAYLLISPPKGLVGSLATMWSSWRAAQYAQGHEKEFITNEDLKFVMNPTLTLFCQDDNLISARKLRSWCERMEEAREEGKSGFSFVEVKAGGHFWHDHDALRTLTQEVKAFAGRL
ncbi:hypothetical protein BP5796_03183 [Coleophoma crateriformis]|uniref:AB hydrolase-1 domain-containing protein n=1 Tax=Coleophoma crateriformis TaxID=565419 RepID=A0A3D8SMB4_9HELO|nr:hypothetical protein BP5796_03183 [Coleophoma crateriformis]